MLFPFPATHASPLHALLLPTCSSPLLRELSPLICLSYPRTLHSEHVMCMCLVALDKVYNIPLPLLTVKHDLITTYFTS